MSVSRVRGAQSWMCLRAGHAAATAVRGDELAALGIEKDSGRWFGGNVSEAFEQAGKHGQPTFAQSKS